MDKMVCVFVQKCSLWHHKDNSRVLSFDQVIDELGEVLVTNDGATIMEKLQVTHPTARMVCVNARPPAFYLFPFLTSPLRIYHTIKMFPSWD